MNEFQATVSALCYSILRERCPESGTETSFPHNQTVQFVLQQHGRMAEFLRIPLACVTLAFGWSSVLRHGKRFRHLEHPDRWRHIEAWRHAPIAVCRDLIRFYESFVIFHDHSLRAKLASRCPDHHGNAPRAAA